MDLSLRMSTEPGPQQATIRTCLNNFAASAAHGSVRRIVVTPRRNTEA